MVSVSMNRNLSVDGEYLALLSIKRTSNLVFVGSPSNSESGRPYAPVFLIIMYMMNSMYRPSFSESYVERISAVFHYVLRIKAKT